MLSEPRTIALIVELIHLPMQHAIGKLRNLYTQLCTECEFENFTRRPGGARIERPASEEAGLSRLTFSPDRVQFTEEGGLLTLDSFCRRLEVIMERTMDQLGIPLFLMEQCTVRSVVTPGAYKSASDFIGARLTNVASADLSLLGRHANVFGFRLVVPPTPEHRNSYNVRIEVYARDPKSLYLENVGTFRQPVNRGDLSALTGAMQEAGTFVSERLCPFLSLFDVPPDGER